MTAPLAGDAKDAQVVGFIVGAHMGEVRFCESKAEGAVAGMVSVTLTIGEAGKPESSLRTDRRRVGRVRRAARRRGAGLERAHALAAHAEARLARATRPVTSLAKK